jgi:hypothetical protein
MAKLLNLNENQDFLEFSFSCIFEKKYFESRENNKLIVIKI